MAALREEMAAQSLDIAGEFMWNDGRFESAEDLLSALSFADAEPLTMSDPEGRELWSEWLAFLRVAARGHGGIVVW